jgi:hypothetical protein
MALSDGLVAHNSGNLIFLERLQDPRHARCEITPDRLARRWARTNQRTVRRLVIPLANAFRATFADKLAQMTKVIEKLKIPVVVLGAGLQSPLLRGRQGASLHDTVKAFAAAVLDRSPTIGVRGEYTQDYAAARHVTSRSSAPPRCSCAATSCP